MVIEFFVMSECRYERYIFALEEASRDVLASLKDKSLKVCLALCCVLCYSWVKDNFSFYVHEDLNDNNMRVCFALMLADYLRIAA